MSRFYTYNIKNTILINEKNLFSFITKINVHDRLLEIMQTDDDRLPGTGKHHATDDIIVTRDDYVIITEQELPSLEEAIKKLKEHLKIQNDNNDNSNR